MWIGSTGFTFMPMVLAQNRKAGCDEFKTTIILAFAAVADASRHGERVVAATA